MKDYVLITGASSGIGRQIAVTLSAKYPLILGGRDENRLQETARLCQHHDTILWCHDLKDVNRIRESLLALLQERAVFVQAFVHSAGISPLSPLRMLKMETMQDIMTVNFFSAVEILKVLAKKKSNKQTLSRVVFISSIASQIGTQGQSVYAASKGALDAFMRSAAVELAPRVRLNCVLPGAMPTSMGQEIRDAGLQKSPEEEGYLLGEGTTQDVADMVAFLLSPQSRWLTGQCVSVDGGRLAH